MNNWKMRKSRIILRTAALFFFALFYFSPAISQKTWQKNQSDTLKLILKELKRTNDSLNKYLSLNKLSVPASVPSEKADSSVIFKNKLREIQADKDGLELKIKAENEERTKFLSKIISDFLKTNATISGSILNSLKLEVEKSVVTGRQQLLNDLDEFKRQSEDLIFVSDLLNSSIIDNDQFQRAKSIVAKMPDKTKYPVQAKYLTDLKPKFDYFILIGKDLDAILEKMKTVTNVDYRTDLLFSEFKYIESSTYFPFLKKKLEEGKTKPTKSGLTF